MRSIRQSSRQRGKNSVSHIFFQEAIMPTTAMKRTTVKEKRTYGKVTKCRQ